MPEPAPRQQGSRYTSPMNHHRAAFELVPFFNPRRLYVLVAFVVLVLTALLAPGCRSVSETKQEQVPGETWFWELDTRTPISANPDTGSHPLARMILAGSIGVADAPPKPVPIQIKAPDGSTLTLPPDFQGRVRAGASRGDEAATSAPAAGGVTAYAKATMLIASSIKTPPKGVPLILIGGLLLAAGIGLGITRKIDTKLATAMSITGAVLLALGWLLDSPLMGWLVGAAVVAGCVLGAVLLYEAIQRRNLERTVIPIAKAINNAEPEAYERAKADVEDYAGADAPLVEKVVKRLKRKANIKRTKP